ncbi:5'-nucleotidase C-terminal domain-containing protein [Bacillus sp. CGMCC 1.16607]|uniref:5'-nucleotidase C-terminal domain-containing protein n=1 Tax=Bacillus sp. CGMCC 1.16607 TaxID=3351842 RepID=UPI00362AED90
MRGKNKFLRLLTIAIFVLSHFFSAFSIRGQAEESLVVSEDLFISEYLEGSSNNKAIEIFNGTGQEVDLARYSVELYSNGATTPTNKQTLTGSLASGSVYVIANSQANAEILAKTNLKSVVANFNGDDAIVLKKNDTIIDVFGQVGMDPGTGWGTGEFLTVDHTLIRKDSIITGDKNSTDSFDPSIEWNTNPKDFIANLGVHGKDSGTNPDPDPGTGIIKIADAKTKIGKMVIIEGVVTADNSAIGGGKLSTYIQDETAGINVFEMDPSAFPELKEGTKVRMTGSITSYKSLTEIQPIANGIEILATNVEIPHPKPITIADLQEVSKSEPIEGQLVKVTGFVSSIPTVSAGGGYNISFINENFQSTILRVMEGSLDITGLQQGKWYEVTAILSQYDQYQLIPRKAADFTILDPQLPEPVASGLYDSTVASVVDGDTVHLTTPVLGTTKVRFVNIDTPETYHKVVTEADRSQKEHGEAAKAYLNTLLKAGDSISLKIGEEPMDAYGRLLAQIIRKSDNVNVNIEMVEKGYASTYFIWPIGEDYEVFSKSVKKAKDAGLGIWNPANPLMELPFEFRAREQGKGFTRQVGNYFTKKYVAPAEWETVPVEARVFFNSEEEAKQNGYTQEGTTPTENIQLQLLGVNDWHGKIDVTSTVTGVQYGRADYLAAYLREREASNPNTLMIHSGDMFGGSSPVSALLQDEPTIEIMESIGFDVGTVGNHEFDEGVSELLRMINGGDHPNGTKGYDGINFPTVAANIEYKDTGKFVLEPYTVKEISGVKVGFIGVVTTETPKIVIPSGVDSIQFTDEATAINKYVPVLQEQGVEAIVVLAHVPGDQSGTSASGEIADLANNVNDAVDIIFAAHNHKKVNAVVDNKLIVQAWEYGNAFVDIDVEIDPVTKDIVKKSAEIVDVIQENRQLDATVSAILQKYEQLVSGKVNAVVGINQEEMLKGYPTKEILGDNALGNFIADGMKFAMNADFALMNGGGVRDNLNAGEITWGELFNIQPFGNTLVKVDVTGKQFEEILNAMINPAYGPDSFIGGARYNWDTKTNKIVDLYLENGEKVDPAKTYSLVVNNYMYNQTSAKYKLISQYGQNVIQGPEDIEASVQFAKSFVTSISYKAEGRISTDVEAPVTLVDTNGVVGEFFNNKDVKINFTAVDKGIGVKNTFYRINNSTWTTGNEVIITADGRNVVEFYSLDKVGNAEAIQSVTIAIDKTAPIITAPDSISIYPYEELSASIKIEDVLSGVKEITITLDGDVVSTDIKVEPFKLSVGTHKVEITAEDHAGNISNKVIKIEVKMDLGHLDEFIQSGVNSKAIDRKIADSLLSKVEAAQNANQVQTKKNILKALINETKAQSGKKIDKEFADQLIETATAIQNSL